MNDRLRRMVANAAPLAGLILAALAFSAGFWRPLLLYGHSAYIDGWRQLVFDAAIRAGDFYPRWTPDYYYGYGSPIFHFYAPLPYYLTELSLMLGAGIVTGLKITLVITWALSAVFMYLLARDFLSRPASFVAGILYLLAPYHLVDMMVRHAFGEHVAFAFIPLAAWGCVGCARAPSITRFIVGAAGVALLTLSHNITSMIFMPFLGAWIVFEGARKRSVKNFFIGAASAAAGLALSAFFWLPALVEKNLVMAKESLTQEFFRYEDHFVYVRQLFLPFWGYGGSRKGMAEDAMSFQIGMAHWLLLAVGLGVLIGRAWRKVPIIGLGDRAAGVLAAFGVFVGGTFMTLVFSQPIWDSVPLLAFVQFPWRFLTIAAFGASLAAAAAVDAVRPRAGVGKIRIAAVAAVCAVAAYLPYASPRFALFDKKSNGFFPDKYKEQRERLETDGERYEDFRNLLSLKQIHESGENGTSRDDYLPRSVREKPEEPPEQTIEVEGGDLASWRRIGPNAYEARVEMAADGVVYLNQFYFAGWQARVDGAKARANPEPVRGRVSVDVAPCAHEIIFRFASTPLRDAADAISTATLAMLIIALAWAAIRRRTAVEIGKFRCQSRER